MSLFGSLMGDVEDDPIFGFHMRRMRQVNSMMDSLFTDPFEMFGGGQLALGGPRHSSSLMPFMPQMPSLNKLFSGQLMNLDGNMSGMTAMGGMGMGGMGGMGSSFSSSTVVMSSGPHGKPQVYSSSSSTKIGPNGIKETRKTLEDSRTGVKKMSIGHHIGERAHLVEREQNYYSGDAEERQEFINIEEDDAEQFDREFQTRAGGAHAASRRAPLPAITAPPAPRQPPRLALPPAPSASSTETAPRLHSHRPAARRPLRTTASPLTTSSGVRETYGSSHPQRHRHKHHKSTHRAPTEH